MAISVRQQAVLMRRTEDFYQKSKRQARAAGQHIDYRLEDLRAYVLNNLGDRTCLYCRGAITADDFAVVPRLPPERGGSFLFHNQIIACGGCGLAKGLLDYVEFKELCMLLRTWAAPVRDHFLARLRAGTPYVPPPAVPLLLAVTGDE